MITLYDMVAATVYIQAWLADENQWVFAGLPVELVAAMGGLGMLGILVSATAAAVASDRFREAGVVALLVTASGTTIAGIGAPFWGLVAGAVIAQVAKGAR